MDNVIKNISTSVAVLGIAFTVTSNASLVVSTNYSLPNSGIFTDFAGSSGNSSIDGYAENNIYIDKKNSHLERMAEESFGVMRDATEEELKGVDQYIKSISKPTGVNFFSLC